uniref:Uncharacterized protein n=1 Tax=Anguilla anguilla TaxID=7936 RepID=A0A0E9QSP5_ANGAN
MLKAKSGYIKPVCLRGSRLIYLLKSVGQLAGL